MPGPLEGLKKATGIEPEHPSLIGPLYGRGHKNTPIPRPWQTWGVPEVVNSLSELLLGSNSGDAGMVPVLPGSSISSQKAVTGLKDIAEEAYGAVKGLSGKFYSRLTDAATRLPAVSHPNKITQFLASQSAPEEAEYRGLTAFLKGKGNQMVPREDVLAHLRENPITLGEKTYGDLESRIGRGTTANPEFSNPGDVTKYHGYQLPGGENYRETLTTLPSELSPGTDVISDAALLDWYYKKYGGAPVASNGTFLGIDPDLRNQFIREHSAPIYQSGHWDEPNVLVHARTQERSIPVGPLEFSETPDVTRAYNAVPGSGESKGRMIENIQSDWHQAGARGGYAAPDVSIPTSADRLADLVLGEHALPADLTAPSMVPNAPFKKSWPDLALKQQVYDVAQNPELSWVGITPGEASVARGELQSPEFHNVTLPKKLGDLLKPFGGSVEQGTLFKSPSYTPQFNLAHLTPEMKAAILKRGFPIMSLIGLMNAAPAQEK